MNTTYVNIMLMKVVKFWIMLLRVVDDDDAVNIGVWRKWWFLEVEFKQNYRKYFRLENIILQWKKYSLVLMMIYCAFTHGKIFIIILKVVMTVFKENNAASHLIRSLDIGSLIQQFIDHL